MPRSSHRADVPRTTRTTRTRATRSARAAAALAGFALALSLAACSDGQAPPAPPADAAAAAPPVAAAEAPPSGNASTAAPAPAAPMAPLSFSVDDPAIGTEVGVRTPGLGLGTSERAGWLLFGPYATLPAGHYEAIVKGFVQPGHAGDVHADIASGKGTTVIAAADLPPAGLATPAAAGALLVLPFDLAAETRDIEVRIRVTATSRVSVSGFEIRPRP